MRLLALLHAAASLLVGGGGGDTDAATLTARDKAALLVVSGVPAPPGAGGVFVSSPADVASVPPGALVLVDQEGGAVKDLPALPPARAASEYATAAEARAAGRETGRALRSAGVRVDLAPVLDAAGGPLGSRHFRAPAVGVAFGRGLLDAGVAACAKHFPGLGTAAFSTDERPHVEARVTRGELAGFRAAVRAGFPCVMTSHAFYPSLGRFRASLEPATYRLLRSLGFDGVAITDSLNIVRSPPPYWPARAIRAGADMLLYTHPEHARRAIDALVPLAERGELDAKVERVLRLRRQYGAG